MGDDNRKFPIFSSSSSSWSNCLLKSIRQKMRGLIYFQELIELVIWPSRWVRPTIRCPSPCKMRWGGGQSSSLHIEGGKWIVKKTGIIKKWKKRKKRNQISSCAWVFIGKRDGLMGGWTGAPNRKAKHGRLWIGNGRRPCAIISLSHFLIAIKTARINGGGLMGPGGKKKKKKMEIAYPFSLSLSRSFFTL